MKICIVSSARSLHSRRWAVSLATRGHEVNIISPKVPSPSLSNVKIIETKRDAFVPSRLTSLLRHSLNALEIRKIIMKMKPSIINIQSFDYIHPFMTALVNLLGGVKDRLIISTWGSDIVPTEGTVSYWNKLSKRLLLSQAAEITSSSEFLASRASTIIGNPREIRIIPLGVNCEEFSPPNKRSRNNTIRISYIKHLKHKYGPDYLIKAMRIILDEHKNVELVMVGGGPLANCLEHMAQSLEISDKIQFTGFLPHENIPSVLADTDIFAMPTLMESLGVSALEAQAMEVPVVSTRVGGIPEAVVDGLTGILVAPKNEQQLADALIKLINDPGLRNQMGKAGRKHVLKNYEWNTILTKMEGLFTQVYQRSID